MTVVPLHRDRAATIGGSDIASAAGIDPRRSKVMLWLEKTGRYSRPETDAMRWGRLLEPVVFEALREDGYDVTAFDGERLHDSERPYVAGTPDGFVTTDRDFRGGQDLLEVKTTNSFAHRSNGDGAALHHVAQVQLYLHLTGLQRALLAVLVNGQHLETVEVARNDDAIALLLDAAERFHWHIVTDTQPPIGSSDSDKEALTALYPEAQPARRARLDAAGMAELRELRVRREQAAAVAEQVQALEHRLKARLGDAEIAVSPDDAEVLRWANVTAHRIDAKRLRAERPDVAEIFTVPTTSRRFQVL